MLSSLHPDCTYFDHSKIVTELHHVCTLAVTFIHCCMLPAHIQSLSPLQPCCSYDVQILHVQEYVRRLGTLLVGLQEDPQAPDRPCLDTWVAEARALICCIRAYNPEALKKLETSGLYNSVSVEQDLSASFCTQQLVSWTNLAVTALCAMPACRYIRFGLACNAPMTPL